MAAPWVAQMGPMMVPVPHQMPSSQMPYYLTIPEPVDPNVHWLRRLGHEIVRSMFKSASHTGAAFFDHNTFTPHQRRE